MIERRDRGAMSSSGENTIEVSINGEARRVREGLSVRGLLESLDLHPAMVVVERNREILERSAYPETPVEEGDTLELVHFVGGG